MEFGVSFSHRHLKWLGANPLKAIRDFKKLGLKWIRLGCYWDEIEKEPDVFLFRELDSLIKYCEVNEINVVLTAGMKAPRWPEYYLPKYLLPQLKLGRLSSIRPENKILLESTLNFLGKCVDHFKTSKAIKVWQVENEPLDPSGEKWWRITPEFLKKEINLVRKLDPKRKIMINVWGNETGRTKTYLKATRLADIVGLDIYLRHAAISPLAKLGIYLGPTDSQETLAGIGLKVKTQGKEFWLAELQMEPWEPGELSTIKKDPPSFLPAHFLENLNYSKTLNPSVNMLWGFEFWYWRKLNGDRRYWTEAEKIASLQDDDGFSKEVK